MNAPASIPTKHRAAAILALLMGLAAGNLRAQDVEIAWQVIGTGGGIGLADGRGQP